MRGAGGGCKLFSFVNEKTVISYDGDKLIRLWELFGENEGGQLTASRPKRILIGTDSAPVNLFSLRGGQFVGAVCASGAVVVWVTENGSIAFKSSMSSSSASSSFESHVVECNGNIRIAACQANLESGLRLMLFEINFDGLRPELKCLCRCEILHI